MICSGLSSLPACDRSSAHTLHALRQIEGSNHFSLGFNVTEWLWASRNDCWSYPVEHCCPLPVRKDIRCDRVMMRTLEKLPSEKGRHARFLPTSLVMYSGPLCQMKMLAETQAYLRMNLKSKSERSCRLQIGVCQHVKSSKGQQKRWVR